MEVSAFLILAVWTSSMAYLTFGKERERAMVFPDYYFFAERRLVNHTIEEKHVKNLDDCELLCYLNDVCVSLNFKKDLENDKRGHICELNNATHLKYDSELTTDANFHYRGSKSACDKSSPCQNKATCQSGFTPKGYRCLCAPGFSGERCENDVDECNGNHSCHESANCTNTIGSHECQCHSGYTGNGHTCSDIDECSKAHTNKMNECHRKASCINTQGSYNCSCYPEYTGNGFNCKADACYKYKNLSDADRKSSFDTQQNQEACDDQLREGWYRFVKPAGTMMPTSRVPAFRCGTDFPGWLDGTHPTVEDGEVSRTVCFSDKKIGCKKTNRILVIDCGSYLIYKFFDSLVCNSRYCTTD